MLLNITLKPRFQVEGEPRIREIGCSRHIKDSRRGMLLSQYLSCNSIILKLVIDISVEHNWK